MTNDVKTSIENVARLGSKEKTEALLVYIRAQIALIFFAVTFIFGFE